MLHVISVGGEFGQTPIFKGLFDSRTIIGEPKKILFRMSLATGDLRWRVVYPRFLLTSTLGAIIRKETTNKKV
jgi:hypothetical protein